MGPSLRVDDPRLQPDVICCPEDSSAERRADRLVHIVGVSAAVIGAPVLLAFTMRWHGASSVTLASTIYALTLIAMLTLSAAYHLSDEPRRRALLRRGDHAAIFAKIAGTFTPIIVLHGGPGSLGVLTMLWFGAIAGMLIRLFQPPGWDRVAVSLYLALSWGTVVFVLPMLMGLSPTGFRLVLAGGLLYTFGVIFHLWETLPYQNAIWHALVLIATALCFLAIVVEISLAGTV